MLSPEYDEALAEMRGERADVARAAWLLQRARAAGDHRATYALATWYLYGKEPVIHRDMKMALQYLTEASAANVPEALYDLAVFRELGEDGVSDVAAAFELYLNAALRGDVQSIYEVGRCYYYGIGIPKHRKIAAIWMDRAADLGYISEPESEDDG
jgi:TPR repeat protein